MTVDVDRVVQKDKYLNFHMPKSDGNGKPGNFNEVMKRFSELDKKLDAILNNTRSILGMHSGGVPVADNELQPDEDVPF